MSKYIESQLVVVSNENVAASSLFTLYDKKIEGFDKQDIVADIEFENSTFN